MHATCTLWKSIASSLLRRWCTSCWCLELTLTLTTACPSHPRTIHRAHAHHQPCVAQVVHELLVLELLLTLLEKPSDSSIEVAVALAKDVGAFLQDVAPAPANQCAGFFL